MLYVTSLILSSFSLPVLLFVSFISLLIGYLVKREVIKKYHKQVLKLEDEMLANHARILDLEKKLADMKDENRELRGIASDNKKSGLKVS